MENILDKIVARKKEEISLAKASISQSVLEKSAFFNRVCYSFRDFLLDPTRTGIIAEFKRRSPSKGIINGRSGVSDVVKGYEAGGASAISVLTDKDFFGGDAGDLVEARSAVNIPLLRKDFILDVYQLYEAKAWGADIVLLIAAILQPEEIIALSKKAKELGLNVLLEVHDETELLRSLGPDIDAVGINNRNLGNFTVDIQTSFNLVGKIPTKYLKVSESAISEISTIHALALAGFNGFLIGENFMKDEDPAGSFAEFTKALNNG